MQRAGAGEFSPAADDFLFDAASVEGSDLPHKPPPPPSPPPLSPTFPIVMISPSCHPSIIPPTLSKHGLLLVAPDIICFVPVTIFPRSRFGSGMEKNRNSVGLQIRDVRSSSKVLTNERSLVV